MKEIVGTIKELYRYPEKGAPPFREDSLTITADSGILGDCHADGGKRQIALLTMTEKTWMEQQTIQGFCFCKYKENILLEGKCLSEYHPGDCLKVGTAVLEITDSMKSCHMELCALAKSQIPCILAGIHAFAAAKENGVIERGMEVFRQTEHGKSFSGLKDTAHQAVNPEK